MADEDKVWIVKLAMTGVLQVTVTAASEDEAEEKVEERQWGEESILEWEVKDILSIDEAPAEPEPPPDAA